MAEPAVFSILEHKLPERIGLSLDEIVRRRKSDLIQGTDWVRIGRWIKYSEVGLAKLQASVAVPDLAPPHPEPEARKAEVTRTNFPNRRIIECKEFSSGKIWFVRIHPDWRDLFRPRMEIEIKTNGDPVATCRKPKHKYRF